MRKAVVDVGSNSVLIAVGERLEGGTQSVFEASRVTGLGEGTKKSGVLSETGMARTLDALRELFELGKRHGATEIQAAATMAARIASNTAEFQARARKQGTPVVVLSGEDEADLGFQAVAQDPLFSSAPRISIVDPGGQSTELVTADRGAEGWQIRFRRSFPLGTLALRDGPAAEEAMGPEAIMAAVRDIDATIGLEYLPGACGAVAALGASGTNLVTVKLGMAQWDAGRVHGHRLDFEEISRAFGWLAPMMESERARIVGLEPGREGTIHLGALILERFLHALHAAELMVSVRGWRHARLEQLLDAR